MPSYYIARANPEDDADINRLLRQRPMDGLIRITLERAPSPSAAAQTEGYRHDTILVRDQSDDTIIAMGSRAVREVFYNGGICRLGYLGQLRMAQGRHGLKRLVAGYEAIHAIRDETELPFDLTSIVDDNLPARRLLQKGLKNLPEYRALAKLSTFVLPTSSKFGADSAAIAEQKDVAEIVSLLNRYNRCYQFAHVYSEQDLLSSSHSPNLGIDDFLVIREAGRIVACLALWDQRPFKQTVVQSYASWLEYTRPLLNLSRRFLGKPLYPPAPFVIPIAFVSHFAMPELNEGHFVALIRKAQLVAQKLNIQYLAVGFCERHPCHELLRREFRHQRYGSTLYSVHWPDQPPVAKRDLTARIPHPEVARL